MLALASMPEGRIMKTIGRTTMPRRRTQRRPLRPVEGNCFHQARPPRSCGHRRPDCAEGGKEMCSPARSDQLPGPWKAHGRGRWISIPCTRRALLSLSPTRNVNYTFWFASMLCPLPAVYCTGGIRKHATPASVRTIHNIASMTSSGEYFLFRRCGPMIFSVTWHCISVRRLGHHFAT